MGGMSKSARPWKRTPPSWVKITSEEIEQQIIKFARKGLTPSQIGVILRDSHGVPQVKSVTGSKVFVSSSLTVLLQIYLKICTCLSRRLLPYVSIWTATAKIRTPSSA